MISPSAGGSTVTENMHARFTGQQADTDAATLSLGDEFKNTHCLLNSEVLLLLEDLQERRREEAMTLPLPPPSKAFLESFDYAKNASQYSNRELVRSVRQLTIGTPLKEFEAAQICNLAPASVDEAKQLVPSLKSSPIEDDDLQKILDDLLTISKYESL